MFLEYKELIDRDAYEFYRANRRKYTKNIPSLVEFSKAVNGLFSVIEEAIIHSTEGVCLRDFGYFCNIKSKNKKIKSLHRNLLSRYNKEYKYTPHFFPDEVLNGWHMDRTFSVFFKEKLRLESKSYTIHPNVCQGFLISQDFSYKANNREPISGNYINTYKKENRR